MGPSLRGRKVLRLLWKCINTPGEASLLVKNHCFDVSEGKHQNKICISKKK